MRTLVIALALYGALLGIGLSDASRAVVRAAPQGKGIWDGVYTEAQATRGKVAFDAQCAFCHGDDLGGDEGPALVGVHFERNWGSRSLDGLFKKIQGTMPPSEARLVTDKEKIDIVAFVLEANGFPAGAEDLPLDPAVLAGIQIVGKDGPLPARSGALVEVIGCLTAHENSWMLTHSTDPIVSTMDDPAKDAREAASRPLGTGTVRLLDVFPKPDAHAGHKMMAKGLLIRKTDADLQVNVLALEMVAPGCP